MRMLAKAREMLISELLVSTHSERARRCLTMPSDWSGDLTRRLAFRPLVAGTLRRRPE